jgi:hypothetical protein
MRISQRFLMSEFNGSLMTSPLRLRDLLSIAKFPGVHPRYSASGREGQAMKTESAKWRIAVAICVALTYIFVIALTGQA